MAVVAAVAVMAVAATFSVARLDTAADRIGSQLEPLVVATQGAHTAMVEADAAAAAAFLSGGVEDDDQRVAYGVAVAVAARRLQEAAALVGDDREASEIVGDALQRLGEYTGLVEAARSNNRQGFPIGAAYLRAGSSLVHDQVIPDVERLASLADERLDDEYDALVVSGGVTTAVLVVAFAALFVLLLQLQRFLAQRMQRVFNVPLLVASMVALAVAFATAASLLGASDGLSRARGAAYNPILLLSDLRSTAFDARADENLALIARGNGARFLDEFDRGTFTGDSLILEAEQEGAGQLRAPWAAYQAEHGEILALVAEGDQAGAVAHSLGPSAAAFAVFDGSLSFELDSQQRQFDDEVDDARSAIGSTRWLVLAGAIVIAALTLFGVARRIAEYR